MKLHLMATARRLRYLPNWTEDLQLGLHQVHFLSRRQGSLPQNTSSRPRQWNYITPVQTRQFSTTLSNKNCTDKHSQTVSEISTSVRTFHERGQKFRIFHGSTNSTRPKPSKHFIDTSNLNQVIRVDTARKTCLVEPNVPMDRLVEATLPHGLVPPVVMEFPGITVGGGYSGTSGESSSFKHGFFDRTINSVEMVLANGDVVRASESENADLFHGAAGALGTFGVTTLVELRLQDAKKFVETTYHPVSSMAEAIQKLHEVTKDPAIDYVDGILFSPTSGAIITGRLTNTHPPNTNIKIQTFSSPWDPWFYLHVQSSINAFPHKPMTDLIPLAEYLFRYDRGGFWVGTSTFKYFHMPFNRFTRWFLDDFLHTRMMYTALHASGQSKKYIVQDLALPYSTAEEFVDYTAKEFDIWPLWLCPLKQSPLPNMHPQYDALEGNGKTLQPMLNIGLWGFGPDEYSEFVKKNRGLEAKLKDLGGMKWLYAHTYYSEDEFWDRFDREWYLRLRSKYGAEGLPDVYEKVRIDVEGEKMMMVEARRGWLGWLKTWWLFSGFYGIWAAIRSRSYVEARRARWRVLGKGE